MYTPDQYEIVSEINSVACVTAVSLIFGRKIAAVDGPIYYVRGLILTLYGLTWAFDLIACMIVSTNNGNYISCTLGFYNCVLFYTFAKITLYLYFTEKVCYCKNNQQWWMTNCSTSIIRFMSCPCPKFHVCDLYTIMQHLQCWHCISDALYFWSFHVSLKWIVHLPTTALLATRCHRLLLYSAATFWLQHYAQACL